jgi:uncharacterized membrane protein
VSARPQRREPATFRFDPHGGGGGPLGLGVIQSVLLGAALAAGVLCLYEGQLIAAALLLTVAAPVVLARWQGLPLLVWLVLRAAYRLAGPRRWEVDPELVGMSQPIAPAPPDQQIDRGGRDGR